VAYTGIIDPETAHSPVDAISARHVHDILFDRILSGT